MQCNLSFASVAWPNFKVGLLHINACLMCKYTQPAYINKEIGQKALVANQNSKVRTTAVALHFHFFDAQSGTSIFIIFKSKLTHSLNGAMPNLTWHGLIAMYTKIDTKIKNINQRKYQLHSM